MRHRAVLAAALLGFVAVAVGAATFTVINTDDSGAGSLRQAIMDAGSGGPGPHEIHFDIPGSGVHTITPATGYPTISITGGLTIDGTTQPGYAGSPLIAVSCANNSFFAFSFSGTQGTIKGLAVGNCGVAISATSGGPITVQACHLGVDAAGTVATPNSQAISLAGATFAIGGSTAADRNVISGNSGFGIFIGSM